MPTADSGRQPYLSVVVATRNDDHGGDPLKRLQAFVNCFDEQCRRTGLDAELIVVEWNPPPDRPRVDTLLWPPIPSFCAYRFIEVPAGIHQRLRHADVLPLFQMIAKNAGIRRARGRFVLATNIDIIFSTELVDFLASRQLQPGRLYRVDRHDIQPDFPVDARLEAQMDYCASHHLRIHTRWGSDPVDPAGRPTFFPEDIGDGRSVQPGRGWHIREGVEGSRYRWGSECAELLLDPEAAGLTGDAVLEIEIESNPYDDRSWVEIEAVEDGHPLLHARVEGRMRIDVPIRAQDGSSRRRIELRVTGESSASRGLLPAFERRDALHFRVSSARVLPISNNPREGRGVSVEPAGVLPRPLGRWRRSIAAIADRIAEAIVTMAGPRIRFRIVRAAPEFQSIERELRASDEQLRAIAPLRDLADFNVFLRERRPDNLHVNACGDFHLMAREHWDELRAYPEFETFSMNLDGLFSYLADAAGITQQVLDMPIYHLEHEAGSGWSPEGGAELRRRISERGITWFDANTVYIWAAYMRWLRRPMIVNAPGWGFASDTLAERTAGDRFNQPDADNRTRPHPAPAGPR